VTKQVDIETKKSAWIAAVTAVGAAILAGIAAYLLKQRLDAAFTAMNAKGPETDVEKGADAAPAGALDFLWFQCLV
jgi:hypothetical protein